MAYLFGLFCLKTKLICSSFCLSKKDKALHIDTGAANLSSHFEVVALF